MARPVTVVASLLVLSCAGEVKAAGLAAVQADARLCLQGRQPAACERALDHTEQLQRRAADLEAYPCQTLLLALQADVILQQLGQGRGERALADLSAAGRGCAGL
ncbi:hypothetical protein [Synechococcus sp. A15-24]|uniref:hypothetical protein n=1 Tax=Synechococcus sp. A15-24 TaxID=1050635 RepID=UPI00256FF123|nr:hypothetical protein [Synechococcus sp. A15-24]